MNTPNERRTALRSLLAEAESAVSRGDGARASSLLDDLHWFGHDDPEVHRAVHRMELARARARGDARAALGQLLPVAFAGLVARVESGLPSYGASIDIAAPPEVVYDVITDFPAYAEWNPWLVAATGEARVGATVDVDVRLGGRTLHVAHRVLAASPPERFAWCDEGWFTLLAGGRRMRTLERTAAGTRLVQRLVLLGPMAHLVGAAQGASLREGLVSETRALRARAESLRGTPRAEEANRV